METKVKVVTTEVKVYIATDGKEFESQWACEQYEKSLGRGEAIAEAEKLRIHRLDNLVPLLPDGANPDNVFRWYNLTSEDDFRVLEIACGDYIREPELYPDLYCVETCGYDPYDGDAYGCSLTECKREAESLWQWLGYKVTFEKI